VSDVRHVQARPPVRHLWARILGVGFVLWLAAVLVTFWTSNTNLVPTVALLGSFLVPVSFVAWAFEHRRDEHVTTEVVVTAFLVGGLLGVLGASVLEYLLLAPSAWLLLGVGLIEEAVKLVALILVTRRVPRRYTGDGMVLGAAVGFGFAAFESAGYAFNALLSVRGLALDSMVETELLRGVLAPVGHGLWTAVLGGVLFRHARGGRIRITGAVVGTYLWVSVLHALWDAMHSIAITMTLLLTGAPWQYELLAAGYRPLLTSGQLTLFTVVSIGGLVLVAVLSIVTLTTCWLSARREQLIGTPQVP
jgi:protease PrsW